MVHGCWEPGLLGLFLIGRGFPPLVITRFRRVIHCEDQTWPLEEGQFPLHSGPRIGVRGDGRGEAGLQVFC